MSKLNEMNNKNNVLSNHIEKLLESNVLTDKLDILKITFIKDILDMFHQYPTLHGVSIDVNNIAKLKDTWEGMPDLSIIDIEQVSWDNVDNIKKSQLYLDSIASNNCANFHDYLSQYLNGKEQLNFIPYYSIDKNKDLINTSLLPYNMDINDCTIKYDSLHNIGVHLHDNFYYLADSGKESNQFIDEYIKTKNTNIINLNYYNNDGELNINFHEEINYFLGKKISSILFYNTLQERIPDNVSSKKNSKIKI